jgi:hypothetical protein
VFSEGAVTEPDYLHNFYKSLPKPNAVVLDVRGGAGVPYSIVEKCLALKRELRSKRNYALGPQDEIWAVFDVDEHPRLLEAYNLAKNGGIRVAVSNPCIEVWGLLHYGEVNAPMTRHEAQRKLKDIMIGYDHHLRSSFPWGICCGKYEDAIENAKIGRENRAKEGSNFPHDCPSSSFDELLVVLL